MPPYDLPRDLRRAGPYGGPTVPVWSIVGAAALIAALVAVPPFAWRPPVRSRTKRSTVATRGLDGRGDVDGGPAVRRSAGGPPSTRAGHAAFVTYR